MITWVDGMFQLVAAERVKGQSLDNCDEWRKRVGGNLLKGCRLYLFHLKLHSCLPTCFINIHLKVCSAKEHHPSLIRVALLVVFEMFLSCQFHELLLSSLNIFDHFMAKKGKIVSEKILDDFSFFGPWSVCG